MLAMTEDISELTARYTYGTWRAQRGWKPIHVTRAEGVYFWDAAGKRYLDFSSQLVCSNLGHQNQAVIDAICAQAKKLAPTLSAEQNIVINLSGRGDKDIFTIAKLEGISLL